MRTYDAAQIADFMLAKSSAEDGEVITNLKLQKLLYYAAGVMAAVRQNADLPLFTDPMEAWQHGPVIPTQYHRFSQYGATPIPCPEQFDYGIFDAEDLAVLDDVYNFYGQYSAWKLRNMTHEEAPWLVSYAQADKTIHNAQLVDFFRDELDETYIADYQQKARH